MKQIVCFSLNRNILQMCGDNKDNRLKFNYNILNEKLTIFGDHESIYVLYQ